MSGTQDARRRILDAATRLFYREGITATGVDLIAAEAGVGKMSIYRHFKGKDVLVEAVLRERDESHLDWLLPVEPPDVKQVLAVFDRIALAADRPGYRGCPFVRAGLELDVDHPARAVVTDNKRRMVERIEQHLRASKVPGARSMAGNLATLVDGASTECAILCSSEPARCARHLAATAIAAARAGAR